MRAGKEWSWEKPRAWGQPYEGTEEPATPARRRAGRTAWSAAEDDGPTGFARLAYAHARLAAADELRSRELDEDPRTWLPDADEVEDSPGIGPGVNGSNERA